MLAALLEYDEDLLNVYVLFLTPGSSFFTLACRNEKR